MSSFALFRLPYEQQSTLIQQTSGEPLEFRSFVELNGKSGFVVAPFALTPECPMLLIRPDDVTHVIPEELYRVRPSAPSSSAESDWHRDYQIDFANFHAHLENDDFTKLVLSRCLFIPNDAPESPLALYQKACERYPRMMIVLLSTPQSGMWLVATPEILLSGGTEGWQTVALAGTMPFAEDVRWSDKNIQEQRFVATYITEKLEQFTADFKETGPRTIRAGHLAHLRSDFHFQLNQQAIGELLQALHPTPAVCGLPKQEAFRFILQNEHQRRCYYSGFMGPLFVDDYTHLFVTLRCMELFSNGYRLYAGGGILKESQEEQEWHETEIKLDTMRNIL